MYFFHKSARGFLFFLVLPLFITSISLAQTGASLGDFDGDGVDDLVRGSSFQSEAALLLLNEDGSIKTSIDLETFDRGFTGQGTGNDHFGSSVANAGDVNGDGITDIAIGAARDSENEINAGAVWILLMNQDGSVRRYQKVNETRGGFTGELDAGDQFGHAMIGVGDLDGDGVGELIVGAMYDDDGGEDSGALWILFLRKNGTVKAHRKLSHTQGELSGMLSEGGQFGRYTRLLPNNGGTPGFEIVVGAPRDDERGAVWILSFNEQGEVVSHTRISGYEMGFEGLVNPDDYFGYVVNYRLDMDGDGVNELGVSDIAPGSFESNYWILFMNADHTVKGLYKSSFPGVNSANIEQGDNASTDAIRPRIMHNLNFDQMKPGSVIKEAYTDKGFGPIQIEARLGQCEANAATVFDSGCPGGICSGGNQELGTPNAQFGGPGEGDGGAAGTLYANDRSFGNMLIIHDKCSDLHRKRVRDPKASETGGIVTIRFPEPVHLFGYTVIDSDGGEVGKSSLLGAEDEWLVDFSTPDTGDNGAAVILTDPGPKSEQRIAGIGYDGVWALTLGASGTVGFDNIAFFVESEYEAPIGASAASTIKGLSNGTGISQNIASKVEEAVHGFTLHEAYPNPFNPSTTLGFTLTESARVRLIVYDVLGREIERLVDGVQEAGVHEVQFDASHLPSGTYLYRLETPHGSLMKRLLLLK